MAPDPSCPEVLPWLKSLPLAPEYRPTLSEFRDPIAYILKIEPDASRFGICKIVPPLPAAPKPTAVANLNLSFSARSPSGDPTFTTRQQQIGFCPRRPRPVQKPVWQSGSRYTLPQFEAKARSFERAHLRRSRKKKSSSSLPPLEAETLYWKAAADKPFSVEYANDMPGSGFAALRDQETGAAAENVGETAWNMRGVARAKWSLLRFMREEIPGVTSPMVYVAMMFSWFAWHVEDHDLHSLNYLHMGAGKTWYGVPRDAALAFEDVVRVHGYGGEVNPLITFATLVEKTTVMSPEVLIGSGIPCCRLVQNAGEFVVTFPGSYHSGFSHGFNCGEASNIATPEWLKVAKEAALRRASTNCPPMVSHYQLLYALSLSLFLRSPTNMVSSPKSSRLKNKLRGLGETMIKETFVENLIQNNNLLSILLDNGSSCVILPHRTSDNPLYSALHLKLQMNVKPRIALGLCSGEDKMEGSSAPDLSMGSRSTWTRRLNGFSPAEENSLSVYQRRNSLMTKVSRFGCSGFHHSPSEMQNMEEGQNNKLQTDGFLDKGLLSCVTCGILNYACVAVIQPREATAGCLMSTDCNSLGNQIVGFEEKCDFANDDIRKTLDSDVDINIGNRETIHSSHQVPVYNYDLLSDANAERGASALDLLASVYGDLSDSEEAAGHDTSVCTDGNNIIHSFPTCNLDQKSTCPISSESLYHNRLPSKEGVTFGNPNYQSRAIGICTLSKLVQPSKLLAESCYNVGSFSQLHENCKDENVYEEKMWFLTEKQHDNIAKAVPNSSVDNSKIETNSLIDAVGNLQSPEAQMDLGSTYGIDQTAINSNDMMFKQLKSYSKGFHHPGSSNDSAITGNTTSTSFCTLDDSIKNSCVTVVQASDKDSSRSHVFCLEHAVEVEKRLRAIGGVNMLLLCHPEYPKIESGAKLLAKELGLKHHWKDVQFRNATEQDQEKIRIAIEDEGVIPCNGDWTVKLGINLYYSVNLSKSPLFRKQLPYNEVIYKSFAQKLSVEQKSSGRVPRRQKKIILAGKWCGKVWMSNQVHPFLADPNISDHDEVDQRSEGDRDIENDNQSILSRRKSNNNAAARRKPGKKRKNSAFRSSIRTPAHTKLDNSSDTGYAEQHSASADGEPDTDQKSEADTDIEDEKQVIQPVRNVANDSAAARMKSAKKMKSLAVRSSSRKSAHTRLENSSDTGCGEEDFGYADGEPDTDQKSEADSYIEDEKKEILPRRNSTNNNAADRRKSVNRRNKSVVSSSTRKHSRTRIDDSSDAGYAEENSAYADGDPDIDQRFEADTDIENDKQAILSRRNLINNNAAARSKSVKKRTESSVRSSTRKPAHTRLDNSSDAGYADDDQDADQMSEAGTDLEFEKQEILPRGNLTNNISSTRRKSGRKRKRSKASCTRKPAHTKLDSSGGTGNAEHDSSAKCGRNLSCLRSTSKGSTRKPPSMRLRKRCLKSGEAKAIVAPEKCNKKKKLKKAPDYDPDKEEYPCDVEGCCMSFATKHDLAVHKRNVCPEKGCGKKFFSHKYLLQHQKVHSDDRPLKCPWKGCKMTFKWAWARTEHIRVHTGERPYVCREPGCDQTFRFVSDFSRHRRKTGHCSAKKGSA